MLDQSFRVVLEYFTHPGATTHQWIAGHMQFGSRRLDERATQGTEASFIRRQVYFSPAEGAGLLNISAARACVVCS